MIFVDTGAWFAFGVPTDSEHAAAAAFMASNRQRLVTTDYVYDEVLTLFRKRGHPTRARQWADKVLAGACDFVWVQEADVRRATEVYFRFHDKGWSFTDCVSRVIMERLGITMAFSFDDHFRQFGTVHVVP